MYVGFGALELAHVDLHCLYVSFQPRKSAFKGLKPCVQLVEACVLLLKPPVVLIKPREHQCLDGACYDIYYDAAYLF
jgi:hypothetical protein